MVSFCSFNSYCELLRGSAIIEQKYAVFLILIALGILAYDLFVKQLCDDKGIKNSQLSNLSSAGD